MSDVEGELDLADIDTNQPIPADWKPVEDELPFDAEDKNEGSND